MAPVNAKTVRLARGKHAGPEVGACVMELASMLAGEPFSDRPATASPVAGAVLRALNDTAGDAERRRLVGHAAAVVGSRGDRALECARMAALVEALQAAHGRRRALARLLRPLPRLRLPLGPAELEHAAMLLVRTDRAAAFGVIDALLGMRGTSARETTGGPASAGRRPRPRAGTRDQAAC